MCETPLLLIKVIYFSRNFTCFLLYIPVEAFHLKPYLFYQVLSSCNLLKASLFYCHLTHSQFNQNFKINLCPRINLIDPASNQISNHLEDQRLFTKTQGKQIGTPGGTVC